MAPKMQVRPTKATINHGTKIRKYWPILWKTENPENPESGKIEKKFSNLL